MNWNSGNQEQDVDKLCQAVMARIIKDNFNSPEIVAIIENSRNTAAYPFLRDTLDRVQSQQQLVQLRKRTVPKLG